MANGSLAVLPLHAELTPQQTAKCSALRGGVARGEQDPTRGWYGCRIGKTGAQAILNFNLDDIPPPTCSASAGRVHVAFAPSVAGVIEPSAITASTGGFALDGEAAGAAVEPEVMSMGRASAEFVVGAPRNGAVLGGPHPQGTGGFAIDGEQKTDLAGFSVGMGGDVNGDGFADLVIGAWGFPGGAAQGRAYVVFGSPTSLE